MQTKYLPHIAVLFTSLLIISNTIGVKIVAVGPLAFSAGVLVFPMTYILGDVLTEVYGYRATRKVVWGAFAVLVLMSLSYLAADILPPAPDWPGQEAFSAILGFAPRLVIASIIAFFFGELTNSFVLSKMKVLMEGRRLWMRTIGSTVAGEGVDTVLFTVIAFWGTLPAAIIGTIILTEYVAKVVYEAAATPLTYRVVARLKKAENIDVYDRGISYNPFRLSDA